MKKRFAWIASTALILVILFSTACVNSESMSEQTAEEQDIMKEAENTSQTYSNESDSIPEERLQGEVNEQVSDETSSETQEISVQEESTQTEESIIEEKNEKEILMSARIKTVLSEDGISKKGLIREMSVFGYTKDEIESFINEYEVDFGVQALLRKRCLCIESDNDGAEWVAEWIANWARLESEGRYGFTAEDTKSAETIEKDDECEALVAKELEKYVLSEEEKTALENAPAVGSIQIAQVEENAEQNSSMDEESFSQTEYTSNENEDAQVEETVTPASDSTEVAADEDIQTEQEGSTIPEYEEGVIDYTVEADGPIVSEEALVTGYDAGSENESHTHNWSKIIWNIHHDAEYTTVTHPASEEGHYTEEGEWIPDNPAWTEQVLVREAYDEPVTMYVCRCGAIAWQEEEPEP